MTEATVLTKNNHPVSIFSKIHSSKEKNFTSINHVTFSAMERAAALFGKATLVLDRGYDDNKRILATELRNRRKGKVKLPLFYKGMRLEAYLSHVKVQITAFRKNISLVLVYGIPSSYFHEARNQCP